MLLDIDLYTCACKNIPVLIDIIFIKLCYSVADPGIGGSRAGGGGACPAHAPYGTQFFHFHIHFHRKVPTSEVHAPLMGAHPLTGNPGSATARIAVLGRRPGGCQSPTLAFFGRNGCENERIGSRWGKGVGTSLDQPMF